MRFPSIAILVFVVLIESKEPTHVGLGPPALSDFGHGQVTKHGERSILLIEISGAHLLKTLVPGCLARPSTAPAIEQLKPTSVLHKSRYISYIIAAHHHAPPLWNTFILKTVTNYFFFANSLPRQ